MPRLFTLPKHERRRASSTFIFIRLLSIILFLALLTLTLTLAPQVAAAPGDPPGPLPCNNPVVTSNLTDNFLTDDKGDPPGPQEEETTNNPDALKFTASRIGKIGELPAIPIRKQMQFTVNFSRLQALFGASNSNYAEGLFQDQNHARVNLLGLTNSQLQAYQGVIQRTAPKVMTDALRENYIKYIWEKPEIAESAIEFSDIAGTEPKTIHDLVESFGGTPPQAPRAGEDKTIWNTTWGKYWEKIPTSYDEFYLGKLEFRAYFGQPVIEKLKAGEPGYCDKFSLMRSVEFPVPRFFRTAQTTGVLNQMMLPKIAQSEQNNLIDITGGVVASTKTSAAGIFKSCFDFAANNPVSKVIRKVVKISMNSAMDNNKTNTKLLAKNITNPISIALKKFANFAQENLNPATPVFAVNRATNLQTTQNGCGPTGKVSATLRWTRADDPSGGLPIQDQEMEISLTSSFSPGVTQTVSLTASQSSRTFTDFFAPDTDYWWRVHTQYFGAWTTNDNVASFRTIACTAVPTPACVFSPTTLTAGDNLGIITNNFTPGSHTVKIAGRTFGNVITVGSIPDTGGSVTIPTSTVAPQQYDVLVNNGSDIRCTGILQVNAAPVPGCTVSPTTQDVGSSITVTSRNGLFGEARMALPGATTSIFIGNLPANGFISWTIPIGTAGGTYIVRVASGVFVTDCGNLTVNVPAPACTLRAAAILYPGDTFTVTSINYLEGPIQIAGAFWDPAVRPSVNLGYLTANATVTVRIPTSFDPGLYAVRVSLFAVTCGDVSVDEWTLTTTPIVHGDIVNFSTSPAPNNNGGQMKILIYKVLNPDAVDVTTNLCFPDASQLVYESNVNSSPFAWPKASVQRGKFFAILAKNGDHVSTHRCFEARFLLTVTVDGRNANFTIAPPVHVDPSVFAAVAIVISNTDLRTDVYDSGGLAKGTTTHTWTKAPGGNYRACLSNLALGVWDDAAFSCVNFEISFTYPFVSAPLDEDSCIKLHKEGKAGNAPYCAIYNLKFDPKADNPLDIVNIIPGECANQTDQYKLNTEPNVICTFTFTFDSNILAVDGNPSNDLKIPATGNGNWDECTPPVAGVDYRTCYLTVSVWPNFRIPFLSQAWNNTLYSDTKEVLPTLQQTGRPGVYTFAQPKIVQEISTGITVEDFERIRRQCISDTDSTANPPADSEACNQLFDLYDELTKDKPGYDCDPGPRLIDLLRCFGPVFSQIGKNLPGQVNDTSNVAGINTSTGTGDGGAVLGENTNQKERFIGGVECAKHLTRDIMLKPKIMQQYLGIDFQCDLTASSEPTDPGDPPPPPPPPPPGGGSGCDGTTSFASLLPTPIPSSSGSVSRSLVSGISTAIVNAAKYGSQKSTTACEILIGIHYVEAGWNTDGSFISGTTLGSPEPQVPPTAASCTAYGGTITDTGCVFNRLEDTAYYAGDHIKDKMAALVGSWRPPNNFNEMIGAMSLYNGGGNANCGTGVPYTGPCPPPTGIDDIYAVSHFDSAHATMYLVYCSDYTLCDPPELFTRDGAATAAKEFFLR